MEIIISLIILGVLLMFVEMLLIPGVGVAGILSFASFVGACAYAFVKMNDTTGWIVTGIVSVVLVIFIIIILRGKTWKRFELKTEIDAKATDNQQKASVGMKGETITRLAPMGSARFDSLTLEVKSFDSELIDPYTKIEVVSIENDTILVKQITE